MLALERTYRYLLPILFILPKFCLGEVAIEVEVDEERLAGGMALNDYAVYAIDSIGVNSYQINMLPFKALKELKLKVENNFLAVYTGTQNPIWIKFSLKNVQADSLFSMLNIGVFDSLSLYKEGNISPIIEGGLLAHIWNSDYSSNVFLRNKYAFPIELAPNESVSFLLRVKNYVRFEEETINLMLYTSAEDYQIRSKQLFPFLLFNGLFFGVLIFLLLFFGVQFLQDRSKTNLFYLLYLGSIFFYFWWKFEKANSIVNILALIKPEWHYFYEVPISICIYASYTGFVLYFMDVKKANPKVFSFIIRWLYVLAIYLFLSICLSFSFGTHISGIVHLFARGLFLYPGFYVLYHLFGLNKRLFIYILLGTLTLLIGSVITATLSTILSTHYQGPWDIPLLPIKIASMIDILFFSLGIGYKNSLIQEEKSKAQQNLIEQMRENERIQLDAQIMLEAEIERVSQDLNLKNEELQNERETKLKNEFNEKLVESELKVLRAQLNPHFIFNCIIAITNLVAKGENELAEKYLRTFSKVMRFALTYSKIESASLEKEMLIAKNYIQMEALRFQDQFAFQIEVDPNIDLNAYQIPPLILQPHIENAIKHGLLPKVGERELLIRISPSENGVTCMIDDNGVGRNISKEDTIGKDSGDGVRISDQRLALFNKKYKRKLHFEFVDKKDHSGQLGTQVILHIPNTNGS